ncbi:BtpA/SgcQ family protein [Amycolatopsis jiangsuensis]|uniref:Membrane complex biogenesis BtpA family protein n=1 Tax=Amycolatopsis jiangsuensis TaxID=1181879 RepID=A0A840J3Z2_9PSEU|nr:BtpA/SgcQ family protein [Amycolatopsis jiangsuensis]MBB4688780.1 membrane complex biogenesis BtpA family protein [Amycolatopsis jiangsuensis]
MPEFAARAGHKVLLGMIHLPPLPGSPYHRRGALGRIVETAVRSARALENGGADGCLVQTADRVYGTGDEADPARVAAMTLVVSEVVRATGPGFRTGVQIMRNAVSASLAVATVAGASFVRAATLVGATLSPQGLVEGDPLRVMSYRRSIEAEDVALVADVDSMHFSWLSGDKTTGQVAKWAVDAGADAVTLAHRDEDRTLAMIASVRETAPAAPVLLAGYTNHRNAARLVGAADGAFVGTCLESDGWGGEVEEQRVHDYVTAVRAVGE